MRLLIFILALQGCNALAEVRFEIRNASSFDSRLTVSGLANGTGPVLSLDRNQELNFSADEGPWQVYYTTNSWTNVIGPIELASHTNGFARFMIADNDSSTGGIQVVFQGVIPQSVYDLTWFIYGMLTGVIVLGVALALGVPKNMLREMGDA